MQVWLEWFMNKSASSVADKHALRWIRTDIRPRTIVSVDVKAIRKLSARAYQKDQLCALKVRQASLNPLHVDNSWNF
jgi:hypothetical protein